MIYRTSRRKTAAAILGVGKEKKTHICFSHSLVCPFKRTGETQHRNFPDSDILCQATLFWTALPTQEHNNDRKASNPCYSRTVLRKLEVYLPIPTGDRKCFNQHLGPRPPFGPFKGWNTPRGTSCEPSFTLRPNPSCMAAHFVEPGPSGSPMERPPFKLCQFHPSQPQKPAFTQEHCRLPT